MTFDLHVRGLGQCYNVTVFDGAGKRPIMKESKLRIVQLITIKFQVL